MSKHFKGRSYIAPKCAVEKMEIEQFICVSVQFNPNTCNKDDNWDNKGEHNMGTGYVGDPNSLAPAKEGIFDDED